MKMAQPEAKKKKPSILPRWPPEPQRIDAAKLDKPPPELPPRPKQNELSQIQFRLKRLDMDGEANRNMPQSEAKEKKPETPVPAPRRAEKERNWTLRHSQRNKQISAVQSDAATDTKQTRPSVLTAKIRRSLKDKKMSFISHVTDNQDRGDDAPDKKTTSTKPGVLKGVMKHLKSTSKVGGGGSGGDLDPDKEETDDQNPPEQSHAGFFNGMFKKKPAETAQPDEEQQPGLRGDLSDSSDSLSEKAASEPQDDERSLGSDGPSEENNKEKAGLFGGFFKKAAKASQPDQDESMEKKLSASSEDLSGKAEKDRGLFGVFLKKTPKGERADSPDSEEDKEQATTKAVGGDDVADRGVPKDKNLFSNMFKKPQKPTEGDKYLVRFQEALLKSEVATSGSLENLSENVPKVKKGGLAGIFRRSNSQENLLEEEKGGLFGGLKKNTNKAPGEEQAAGDKQKSSSNDNLSENTNAKGKSIFSGMFKKAPKAGDEESNGDEEKKLLSASNENLTEEKAPKEKMGGLAGMLKKSPKPAPRSLATKDLQEESVKDDLSGDELAGPPVDLEAATAKEKKGGFAAMFKRTPKTADKQDNDKDEEAAPSAGGVLKHRRTIKKKRRVISFRVKTTLPRMPKLNGSSQAQEMMPVTEESLEMQETIPAQSTVEVQPVEMAAYPTEGNPLESEEENDGLMEWWKNVIGWAEWNETANFQEDEEGIAMEEAADRVYMAARLFVRLFNQRGASLQHCILELLAVADTADQFHKKTISAAVGGRVASVAGSLTTITGLILAPFTFGASIIVTAVGIGVATAGSIASATANITDAVHSNMDRKKVEKMIQDYQEQIKDIRECMNFVQEGIDTLQEWDFEKYSQSAAKKAMNRNIKHVVKEGGRAGKALMINTDKLISTVQVLSAGAGAAKAAQAISVTTGVMSALFLALDVFFLAKDSHDLRKGAKTKFASKIRDVCKELQDGLLELNKVKTQLQKTMDGIEVEEYEEIEEVEVEVDDDLELDPKKLAELELELDLMELKLDKGIEWGKIAEKKEGLRKKDKMDKEIENQTTALKEKQEKETAASHKKVEEKPQKKDKGEQDERRDSQQSRESSRRDHTEWRIASSHRSHHRRAEERVGDEVHGEEKRTSRTESARKKLERGGDHVEDYRGSTERHRRGSD